jgi:hypothetical protein
MAVFVKGWLSSGSLPNLIAARIGFTHAPLLPSGPDVSLLLALGLMAYVAGLFAPLRTTGRN